MTQPDYDREPESDPDGDPEMLQSEERAPTQPNQAEGDDDPAETGAE
ncbi:MAG: hypothetical protein LLG14_10370 [Nocardiaceae bacterium]|nr:hypothetical protein [Nocardiaceae bacterium]